MHTADVCHVFEAPMTSLFRFQCHIPAALLLIQTTQKHIHLVMEHFVWMICWRATDSALALVNPVL